MIKVDPVVVEVFAAHAMVVGAADPKKFNAAANARDDLVKTLTREQRDAAAFIARSVLRLVER